MANTVIELKHSQTPGNTPASLANGEISINTYDGKIFYKDPSGVIRVYTKYPGPSGLDTEIQFNDGGSLGANASLSFNKSTGTLSTKLLSITNSVGDEGGEILLAKPVSNTTLSGTGIVVDSYQNKIRFFEQGGSARGAYIDLTECSGGAGTNLLNPGATPDSVARATANAAYEKANGAYDTANTDVTNITLASPGVYGNSTIVPVFTVAANGRISAIANVAISAGASITVANDTTTNSDGYYPTLTTSTTGSLSAITVSSTKLYYNPSTGTLSSTNYNTLSDKTLKENIDPIVDAMSIVEQLNPVSFNWKDNGIKAYGIIAQEIEEVLPNLVETKRDGIKSVSYLQLIPILIQAIKEQQQEINKLKKGKK